MPFAIWQKMKFNLVSKQERLQILRFEGALACGLPRRSSRLSAADLMKINDLMTVSGRV
jgi:hypothetical protein